MVRCRRKDTGEIVKVASFSNYGGRTKYYDKDGNLHETNLNLYKSFEEIPEIDWEQRRYEIADCNESYTFDMSTIRTDIDEDAPEEQLLEWYSYTEEASLFNLTTPNFHHWLHGCPRSSPEELQHLKDMKQEFEDKIKEINEHNSY